MCEDELTLHTRSGGGDWRRGLREVEVETGRSVGEDEEETEEDEENGDTKRDNNPPGA